MAKTDLEIIIKARDEASATLKNIQSQATSLGKNFTIAGGLITGALGLAVKAAADAEQQVARTNAITKTLSSVAADAGIDLEELAGWFEDVGDKAVKLGFDNEQVSLSMAQLTKSTGDVMVGQRAVGLAMDFARAKSIDLESATKLINLALQGSPKILTSYGIALDDTATKTDVLNALTTAFGGTAADTANTLAVQTEVLNQTFGNLVEQIGGVFLPLITQAIQQITPFIEKIIEWTNAHPELTKNILLAVGAVGVLLATLGPILLIIGSISSGMLIAGVVIAALSLIVFKLIQNWEEIKIALEPVLFQLKEMVAVVGDFLKPAIDFLIVTLMLLWEQLKFLWDLLSPILIPVLKWLAIFFGATLVGVIAIAIGAIAAIALVIAGFIEGLKSLIDVLGNVIIWFQEKIPAALTTLGNFWISIWDKIKQKTQEVVDFIESKVRAAIDAFDRAQSILSAPIRGAGNIIKSTANLIGRVLNVDDAIITPQGQVIKTDPRDFLLATRNPAGMGGGISITITGNTFMSDERAATRIGDMILNKLKLGTRVSL